MAIERVPCEKCGNIVASTSRLCPVCGTTSPNGFRNTVGSIIGLGFIGFAAFSIITGHHDSTDQNTVQPDTSVSNTDDSIINQSDEAVSETTADPPKEVVEEPSSVSPTLDPDQERSLQPEVADQESPQAQADDVPAFEPLQSDKVSAAIRKAAESGETIRWKDGKFTGYAVPSTPDANGCRSIRYTVDQQPSDDAHTVNSCTESNMVQ